VSVVVYGAGEVSFWWKTSSEMLRNRKYDYVSFTVDGAERSWLGGETGWTNETFAVEGAGAHTLSWAYIKNENGASAGEDGAWLGEVPVACSAEKVSAITKVAALWLNCDRGMSV